MENARIRPFRHTGLYYRNTLIVWLVTVIVFWWALTGSRNWLSMSGLVLGIYLNYFLWSIYLSVHPRRPIFWRRVPQFEIDLQQEKVTFFSLDGLKLFARFIPGRKSSVIVLLHGLGRSGLTMLHQARMLNKAGYNVILPDLRAHGDSEGDTITNYWEVNDVLGVLEYLETRPGVDVNQVGILGISFGASVALQVAARSKGIRALVLESLGPTTLKDHGGRPQTLKRWINLPFNWLIYKLFDFMSGVNNRQGVLESLRLIYPRPVLFISAGRGKEQYFMRLFYDAARRPKSLLEVPRAEHGVAFVVNRKEYSERVLQLFDQALA